MGHLVCSAKSFTVRATTGILETADTRTERTPATACCLLGVRFGPSFDPHGGKPKIHVGCSCETWETVENSGVVHLDQLTGLGVRELEAEEEEEEEETGRPLVVEASDSNSYPQVLEQPASKKFYSTSSYHVTNRVTSDTYLCL